MTTTVNENDLLAWFKENQILLHPDLRVGSSKSNDDGLGIYTKKDLDPTILTYRESNADIDPEEREREGIPEFEIVPQPLARIPKLSIFSAKNSCISNLLSERQMYGIIALIIAFIYEYELEEESPWFGYFKSLEFKSLDVPPAFWDPAQRSWLKGTEAETLDVLNNEEIVMAMEHCVGFAEDINEELGIAVPKILQINGEEDNTSKLEHFSKISVLISSRCFDIDDYHQFALVPCADLFNHSSGLQNCHFESTSEVCEICGHVLCEHLENGIEDGDEEMDIDYDGVDDEGQWEDEGEDDEVGDEEEEEEEEAEEEEEEEGQQSEHQDQNGDEEILEITEITEDFITQIEEESKKLKQEKKANDNTIPEYLKEYKNDFGQEIHSIDCCDIVIDKKVNKGQQLYSTYGELSNPLLLLKYQFAELENEHGYVSLSQQIIAYKKSNVKKVGERFKWWKEVGYDIYKTYMKQNAFEDEDELAESDEEEEGDSDFEDEEEFEESEDSWLSELTITADGNFSFGLVALVKLLSVKQTEFEKWFLPDKTKSQKAKNSRINKHIKKQNVSNAINDDAANEKYFNKILKHIPSLLSLDTKCYKILEGLISSRLAELTLQNALVKEYQSPSNLKKLVLTTSKSKYPVSSKERRKSLAATVVYGELLLLTEALSAVQKHV